MKNGLDQMSVSEFDHRVAEGLKYLDAEGAEVRDTDGEIEEGGLQRAFEAALRGFFRTPWPPADTDGEPTADVPFGSPAHERFPELFQEPRGGDRPAQ
jgi:hypothetical protein